MNIPPNPFNRRVIGLALATAVTINSWCATEAGAQSMSASQLASQLSAAQQNGFAYVRLRMEISGKGSLQLQIKERRTKGSSALVYQVLWPKDRQGEAVLLRKAGGAAPTGAVFTPPDNVRAIGGAQMREGLFGSALSYEDAIDDFFAWDHQAIVGTETVGRTSCTILESKPGKGQRSSYASVRSWIDTRRMVPLRVEKLNSSGQAVCRIETTRVADDDLNRNIPATLLVSARGGTTELEGSKIKHDVTYTEREFTPEGLKDAPSSARSTE